MAASLSSHFSLCVLSLSVLYLSSPVGCETGDRPVQIIGAVVARLYRSLDKDVEELVLLGLGAERHP